MPPPTYSQPEALNFPQQVYEMSQDPAPFVPPERYPTPPRDMWYEIPREPPAPPTERPRAIFPWEGHQPQASRVFVGEPPRPSHFDSTSESGEREAAPSFDHRPPAETWGTESTTVDHRSEPATPTTPTIRVVPSDPWTSFTRTNAWDDVPEIERYVEGLQKHRRGRSQVFAGAPFGVARAAESGQEQPWRAHGMKLTDFPSEVERPSLPVTPAPIRRPKFWGGGGPGDADDDDDRQLPAAEGVPAQSDWVCVHGNVWSPADCLCDLTNVLRYHKDPVAQLQKLAKQQSEALLRRLGGGPGGGGAGGAAVDLPSRPLPFGSEGVTSPTYVAQSSGGVVLSPQPVKGSTTTSMVRGLGEEPLAEAAVQPRPVGSVGANEEEATTPTAVAAALAAPMVIMEPAYTGPGLAWEKGEEVPLRETPALPTEEERDVLET